jgi:hypothetical protein
MRLTLLALASSIALISYALWPVCVPLTLEQVASFQPSISERIDKDFYLRIFQQRAGQWHQCKTRISRAMFF